MDLAGVMSLNLLEKQVSGTYLFHGRIWNLSEERAEACNASLALAQDLHTIIFIHIPVAETKYIAKPNFNGKKNKLCLQWMELQSHKKQCEDTGRGKVMEIIVQSSPEVKRINSIWSFLYLK